MLVVFRKTTLILSSLALVLMLALTIAVDTTQSAGVFFGKTDRKVPIYAVDTEVKKVALTFDAAWGSDRTEGLMKCLEEYNVPATFFLVQFWVEKYPELVKQLDAQGIEIGTHSATHPHMASLSKEKMKEELVSSMQAIQTVTGKTPTVFRPPFGEYNNSLITTAQELDLKTIQWDVDSLDWKGLSADQIATRILNKVKPGSIILMHNDGEHTLEALPLIIEGLMNKGLGCCTVSDLVYPDHYMIDNAGIQHAV